MKSLLAATLVSIVALSQPGLAEDKTVYSSDVIEKIYYGKDQIRVLLHGHQKTGEFGCKDPHYVIHAEHFGGAFDQVAQIVTDAAINRAEIGLQVTACQGGDKEGASVVSEVKFDLVYDSQGRPGSYR